MTTTFNRGTAARLLVLVGSVVLACVMAVGVAGADEGTFGIASVKLSQSTNQAGAHGDVTTAFQLNTNAEGLPIGQVKDMRMVLPSGIIGNPLGLPRCAPAELLVTACQAPAQVGVAKITVHVNGVTEPVSVPLYNVMPSPGHIATFAASFLLTQLVVQADLSQDGSYQLEVNVHDLTTQFPISGASLTLWGVPASPAHNLERAASQLSGGPNPIWGPPNEFGERELLGYEPTPPGVGPVAFLANSTNCPGGALSGMVSVDSWENPGQYVTQTKTVQGPEECGHLAISPTLSVTPESTAQDTPTGYDIDLAYPLNEEPYGVATPPLENMKVTLPEGTSLSPGATNGLVGCSDEQFAANACPNASKVGTVAVTTPLLAQPLTGTVNLASSTPAAMYRLFLTAQAERVTLHLTAVMHLNPYSGQVSLVVENVPQLPFSNLSLHLFGGPGAALANPVSCGPALTSAQITSYGGPTVERFASFSVDANGHGAACPQTPPFTPTLSAGTTSPTAGAFSPLTVNVSQPAGQQTLSTLAVGLPPGLLGMLSRVPECAETQAQQAACPQTSQIGNAQVGAGSGSEPLNVAGAIYLTGPYKSAPFGVAIVAPVQAGPFNLGPLVIRAQLLVNPSDMHITLLSDAMPQILDGVPLRVRALSIAINRPKLIFNPTTCAQQAISATFGSAQGATFQTSTPFAVSGCHGLPFTPRLAASTEAAAGSRGNGASLDVTLANPAGTNSNLRSVNVVLPRQLRPRLSTIHDACVGAAALSEPSHCPARSIVGRVTVRTPVLSTPLRGAIYLVSRGGGEYPALVMIPQAQGVKVALRAGIAVSQKGVVSTVIRSVPDVPITAMTLELPEGAHSALGAVASLCTAPLQMPYTLTAQNASRVSRTARVAVNGCARTASRAHAK